MQITDGYNKYDLNKASRPIELFINELSTWYLRRSRERIKNNDKQAIKTLKYVLLELSKIIAPIIPFIADYIYKELKGAKESVHLCDWPKVSKKLINKELEKKMGKVREIVSLALQKRNEAGIGVRQPLQQLTINYKQLTEEFLELIKEEINVKEIVFGKTIELDTKITPELKEQGIVREFIRQVQAERKKQGLTPKNPIKVYFNDAKLKQIIEKNRDQIKKQVIAKDIVFGKEFKIEKT
jgi:isoleucyl-tRNA synthetase